MPTRIDDTDKPSSPNQPGRHEHSLSPDNTTKRASEQPLVTPEKQKKKQKQTRNKGRTKQQAKINKFYPNKILKASTYLKDYQGEKDILCTLSEPPQTVMARTVCWGMFTLYYINYFMRNKEGYVYPILRALGAIRERDGKRYQGDLTDRQFREQGNFIAVFPRRARKDLNAPTFKDYVPKDSQYKDQKYKEMVLVKANNGTENKHVTSQLIVDFLRTKNVEAEIAYDTDDQHDHEQCMDHYLMDHDIYRIIKKHWKGIVDESFYDNCPETRNGFFSEPYPFIAQQELGYPSAAPVEYDLTANSDTDQDMLNDNLE